MRKRTVAFAMLFSAQFSAPLSAQTVDPADVDALLNFAEQVEPSLFSPPGQITLATVTDWLYRFYPTSQSYAAVHTGTGGEFLQGGVYTLGGPFGDSVVYIDTLDNLLTLIDNNNPAPDGDSGITNDGNGNCVNMNPPDVGTIANYRLTAGSGALQSVTDFSEEFIQVSDTLTELETTATSSVAGLTSTTVSRSVTNMEIADGLRYVVGIDSQIAASISGFSDTNQQVQVSYEPDLFQGPAERVCEEQEWFAAPVDQTVTIYMNGASVPTSMDTSATSPQTTVVESVNDTISVPAGNFSAVRTRSTFPDITNVIWTDPETGLLLRNENIDREDGEITILTELQSVQ